MATVTGNNLLDSIIESTGIEVNALVYATLSAKLQQMIDNGTDSNLAVSIAMSGFSTPINDGTIVTSLADTVAANKALIEAAADDGAVGDIEFPPYTDDAAATFTLTTDTPSVLEGASGSFTVTASKAVTEDTTITFNVVVGDATAANAGTNNTNLNDFSGGTFNPVTATILAGEKTATFNVVSALDGITELPEAYSVTALVNGETLSQAVTLLDGAGTYTLTTGIDTGPSFVGTLNNDTFNAFDGAAGAKTFTALDSIDGADGMDTFNVIQTAAVVALPSTTVANIEVANITTAATIGVGGTPFDTTGWTGLETLNLKATGATVAKAAATTNVNELTSVAASTITGGKNVTIAHKTAGDVTVTKTAGVLDITTGFGNVVAGGNQDGSATTDVMGTVSVDMTGAKTADTGIIDIDGGTAIDIVASSAVSLADRTAHAAAKTASAAAETKATAAATEAAKVVADLTTLKGLVALNTTTALTMADTCTFIAPATAATPVLTQADKVQIDLAFTTAYAAATGTVAVKQAAGQAAAVAVVDGLIATANTAKDAADAAKVAAVAADAAQDVIAAADVVINAAVDDIVVTATENTALASASVTGNFAAPGNAITDASTNNNTLTTVSLDNAGVTTFTGKGIATANISNQVSNVNIVNATTDNTLALNLDSVKGATVTTSAGDTDVINMAVAGTNALTLVAADTTKLNITGAGNLTSATALTTANAVINASAATGNITTTTLVGQAYTGGSGVDSITSGAGLQTAKVDGGAGAADKMVVVNAANVATTGAALYHNFEVLSSNNTTLDISKFTNSTFTGLESLTGAVVFNNVNATQAANVAVKAATTALTLGVTNATVPGNIDTVNLNTAGTISLGANLTLAGVEKVNVAMADSTPTADDASFTMTALTNMAALTDLTFTGNGSVNVTTGALAVASNSTIDASAVTGTSTDTVKIDATASTDNGLTIKGSATLANTLTAATGLADGKANVLTGGAGNDTITGSNTNDVITGGEGNNTIKTSDAGTDTGTDTVTVGNGNNTITGDNGVDTITAGNGYNVITTLDGNDVITVGTGGVCNMSSSGITGGAGNDMITFAAHAAGVVNIVTQGLADSTATSAQTFAGANIAAGDILTFANGVDTVVGFDPAKGDVMDVANAGAAITLIGKSAANAGNDLLQNTTFFGSGAWDATAKTFTFAADGTGADTVILQSGADDGGAGGDNSIVTNDNMVVLVGVDSDHLAITTFA